MPRLSLTPNSSEHYDVPYATPPATAADVVIVAGEASGDFLAAHLIKSLKSRYPHLRFGGIAGPLMAQAGCNTWVPQEKLAVRGYIEVLRHLPELLKIRQKIYERVLIERPTLFIGIDAPDFNLRLETKLKTQGITTIHYVSPSLWAWRPERIERIREAVDLCLLLFPFEAALYQTANIPHTVIGHPVCADFKPFPAKRFPAPGETIKLAMLPGSRQSELVFHTELFAKTALLLRQKGFRFEVTIPLVHSDHRGYLEALFTAIPEITATVGNSHEVLKQSHLGLIASGTASLEAALANCPHLITYRLHPWTARAVKKKLTLPYVGLPNVLSKRFVVPELLQDAATPENLSQALETLIKDAWSREQQHQAFEKIFHDLDRPHATLLCDALSPFFKNSLRNDHQ